MNFYMPNVDIKEIESTYFKALVYAKRKLIDKHNSLKIVKAEDVVHEAFVKVFSEKRNSFFNKQKGLIFSICREIRHCVNNDILFLRQKKTRSIKESLRRIHSSLFDPRRDKALFVIALLYIKNNSGSSNTSGSSRSQHFTAKFYSTPKPISTPDSFYKIIFEKIVFVLLRRNLCF